MQQAAGELYGQPLVGVEIDAEEVLGAADALGHRVAVHAEPRGGVGGS